MEIIKIGGVELYADEARKLYEAGKYIMTYGKIYQLKYNAAKGKVYGVAIYSEPRMLRRGRFLVIDAARVKEWMSRKPICQN